MKNTSLELMTDDIKRSVAFYTDILGFEIGFVVPNINPTFVSLKKDNINISFFKREDFAKEVPKFKDIKLGGSFVLNIEIDDLKSFYNSVKERVTIIKELYETDYGTLEFTMEDSDGYILLFKQQL